MLPEGTETLGGPAETYAIRFSENRDYWLKWFSKAWTIANSNNQQVYDMKPSSGLPIPIDERPIIRELQGLITTGTDTTTGTTTGTSDEGVTADDIKVTPFEGGDSITITLPENRSLTINVEDGKECTKECAKE
jgi:hypothetical protein